MSEYKNKFKQKMKHQREMAYAVFGLIVITIGFFLIYLGN